MRFISRETKEKIKRINMRIIPLIPLWATLFSIWASGYLLLKLYPGHPLLYLGIAVTIFFIILSTIYLYKVKVISEILEATILFQRKLIKIGKETIEKVNEKVIEITNKTMEKIKRK